MKTLLKIIAISFLFVSISGLKAQSLEETLSNLSSKAAEMYVEPISNAFGSNLNSGWVSRLPAPAKFTPQIELRIIAIGSLFNDDDKRFTTDAFFRFTSAQAEDIMIKNGINPASADGIKVKNAILSRDWMVRMSGPTVIGDEDEFLYVEFPGTTVEGYQVLRTTTLIKEVYGFLDGLQFLPSAAIQLNVGTVMGTNVSVRYFPETFELDDLGKFSMWGLGALHNINAWLKNPLPVDIAVGFFYQTYKVGDVFENKSTQYGVFLGKTFGKGISISPYLGLTNESSETSVKYDYKFETPAGLTSTEVEFDAKGDTGVSGVVGFSANLIAFNFNVDYKIGKTKTLTAGLSFGIW